MRLLEQSLEVVQVSVFKIMSYLFSYQGRQKFENHIRVLYNIFESV
jgi:hypothetical protein